MPFKEKEFRCFGIPFSARLRLANKNSAVAAQIYGGQRKRRE